MIHPGILLWILSGLIFALCTIYYLFELIPAYSRHRKHYLNPVIATNDEIQEILRKKNLSFPRIKFQITTRGNEVGVVKRGINSIAQLTQDNPLIAENIELMIVTDETAEIEIFSEHFKSMSTNFPAEVICVPPDYMTENETLLKARSLQYSIEYRKKKRDSGNCYGFSFIFYFDAESTITEEDFRRIIHSIITSPQKKVLQGPIIYPHKYFKSNVLSRQMESGRPFNCHHCIQVMKKPPPLHLHGSNLLVEEDLVESIGWDFGRVNNQPLLAEDLMFGLKVYLEHGPEPFGWHGGQIHEQPPFSTRESMNARMRWVTGAWQILSLLKSDPEMKQLPWKKRTWILWRIRTRVLIHSLSFFAMGFVLFNALIFFFPSLFSQFLLDGEGETSTFRTIRTFISVFFFLPGTIFWIFGIINGSAKNIEPLGLSWKKRLIEYCKLLLVTPIASMLESGCVLYATLRWLLGKPYSTWHITNK